MDVLILGDGDEERAWAAAVAERPGARLAAAFPGFDARPDVRRPLDRDDALVVPGVEVVIVGGPPEARAESLRRAAAEGLAAVCLHPPGPDSEAYYQVALSRAETGSVLVPDLPARLHPAVVALRQALAAGAFGAHRELSLEATVDPSEGDLARFHFARAVDLVRSLLGEVEAVTATGDPPGTAPDLSLLVQLRGPAARRAEVRLRAGRPGPARLALVGADGQAAIELGPDLAGPARLERRGPAGDAARATFEPWDPRGAILDVLEAARSGLAVHPDLNDGTRAMEVSEAVVRSLRRGRTVDLHYEEISEAATFKSVMTSVGCMLLLSLFVVLPVALAGPAIGMPWTIFIAYAIPPALFLFLLLQFLRFAAREARTAHPAVPDDGAADEGRGSRTRAKGQGTRAKGQETRAKGQGTRAKGQGTRAKGQEPRAKGQEPRAKGREKRPRKKAEIRSDRGSWPSTFGSLLDSGLSPLVSRLSSLGSCLLALVSWPSSSKRGTRTSRAGADRPAQVSRM